MMVRFLQLIAATILLAAVCCCAADNASLPGSATNTTSVDEAGPSATQRLFNTLLVTFFAVFLGFAVVRLQLIDPEQGHMKGLFFFTGQLVFPVLIFGTVATAKLGNVRLSALAACSLGKLCVMTITWVLTYIAYRPSDEPGQRFLTATVFAFFTLASNDFAIGFPIVDALFGQEMNMGIYIAGNALVGSMVFVPLIIVLLTIGKNLKNQSRSQEYGALKQLVLVAKDIVLNPVIFMTLVGLLYKAIFGGMLIDDGIKLRFPSPLSDIVELVSSPFAMCALFMTGATLARIEIALWPFILVLMKVVLCAYATYFFAGFLISESLGADVSNALRNFCFLYGMIPTSSAPLIFAQQFAPESAPEVATAIMMGLAVAGPMMFGSALFFEAGNADMAVTVARVQFTAAIVSLVCGVVFLGMLCVVRQVWHLACPRRALILAYGVLLIGYETLMLAMNPETGVGSCLAYNKNPHGLLPTSICWAQNSVALTIVCLQVSVVMSKAGISRRSRMISLAAIVLSVLLALVPSLVTVPNTVTEMCASVAEERADVNIDVLPNAIWIYVLFAFMLIVGIYDLIQIHRQGRVQLSAADKAGNADDCAEPPNFLVRGLILLQFVRLFIRVVNTTQVLAAQSIMGSFAEMLVVEGIFEHMQLPVLIVLMVCDGEFTSVFNRYLQELLRRIVHPVEDFSEAEPVVIAGRKVHRALSLMSV